MQSATNLVLTDILLTTVGCVYLTKYTQYLTGFFITGTLKPKNRVLQLFQTAFMAKAIYKSSNPVDRFIPSCWIGAQPNFQQYLRHTMAINFTSGEAGELRE